jgi:hypothetical protein
MCVSVLGCKVRININEIVRLEYFAIAFLEESIKVPEKSLSKQANGLLWG